MAENGESAGVGLVLKNLFVGKRGQTGLAQWTGWFNSDWLSEWLGSRESTFTVRSPSLMSLP
jgi:hypothetical protein